MPRVRARRPVPRRPVTARRLQSMTAANEAAYRQMLSAGGAGVCWDYLVLTAANGKQAEGYRHELRLREGSFFPKAQRTLVVPDPPGPRVGSGGATLGVMRALSRRFRLKPPDFDRLRILLVHSGGLSQRLPMYAALGKVFMPLPLLRPDGQLATLFDHLYVTLAGLPPRLGPGLLVAAGDVMLVFDPRDVTAPTPGVTAISMRVKAELGAGHGVFVTGPRGRVERTLQKVSVAQMKGAGATDTAGRVLIDTGLLFFDPQRTRSLLRLARSIDPGKPVDLYEDVTGALAAASEASDFASGARRRLWRDLHGVPFNLTKVRGEFLHLGTTRQFRDAMTGRDPSPAAALFRQNVMTHSEWPVPATSRVYHSALLREEGRPGTLGPGCVVESSVMRSASRIGRGTVISQSDLGGGEAPTVGNDLLLFQVPVRVQGELRYVHVVCGVDDDWKGRFGDGRCTYLNRPIGEWFARHGITPEQVWQDVPRLERTLWNARLFGPGDDWLWLPLSRKARPVTVRRWLASPRMSMAQILEWADRTELIAHRETTAALVQSEKALRRIRSGEDVNADGLIGPFSTRHAYATARHCLLKAFRGRTNDPAESLRAARAAWTVAQLTRRPDYPLTVDRRRDRDAYERVAFGRVHEASEAGHRAARASLPENRPRLLQAGVRVVATSPARLDLAGGWSDTPPYCYERGGHVINVAIDLDGRPPVTAFVSTLREPVLILESRDLRRRIRVSDCDSDAPVDVKDPFCLHKVALRTAGLLPERCGDLSRHWERLGAGLHVTTEARVPKGSGLGTSSILAATLLAALQAACGRRPSQSALIERTLLLEQRLGTGGGWQDQVGGVAPAVKSTVSRPGVPQRPAVEVLGLSGHRIGALEARLVVYFSGQQRLARDILRQVMGRWLAREPEVVELMNALKRSAAALRAALLRGRWSDAARQVNDYWCQKKTLYAGSTTEQTDSLFAATKNDWLAASLAGAGGGGFAYFLCADANQAQRLRDRLAALSARDRSGGKVYETQINRTGLRITKSPTNAETE